VAGLAVLVVAITGLAYARLSRDWSFGSFYVGFLGVVALVVLTGLLWTESAPDGDLRRDPRT
jgi:hypothetical protein